MSKQIDGLRGRNHCLMLDGRGRKARGLLRTFQKSQSGGYTPLRGFKLAGVGREKNKNSVTKTEKRGGECLVSARVIASSGGDTFYGQETKTALKQSQVG